MDVTIVGASGGCGREIVTQIVQQRLLENREILQLVGSNPQSKRPHLLHGFRADLQDAYAEIIPELNVTDDPEKIIGDVVVITGGQTFSTNPAEIGAASRDVLARANVAVFERFARSLASTRREYPPVVIIVTNPVELGVAIFAKYLPRTHVIGMGAFPIQPASAGRLPRISASGGSEYTAICWANTATAWCRSGVRSGYTA